MRLEEYTVRAMDLCPPEGMLGRRKITTPIKKITKANVVEVVQKALGTHSKNAQEIDYLYRYYRGSQDIQYKQKIARANINNKVTVNRANEIVTFKTAYLLNEPVQYISYGGEETVSTNVNRLNEYMRAEDKESKDKEIVDWLHICGVAERMILQDKDFSDTSEGAPFCLFTINPMDAFVIYHAGIRGERLAGVILQKDENEETYVDVYTKDYHYVIKGDKVVEAHKSMYGDVPLIEYINNDARMGAFEIVLSILNNINDLESHAIDGIQDFVNGFDVLQNCDIEDGEYGTLSIGGKALKIKTVVQGMEAKVYRVASELSQTGVQTRIDDLTDAYLTICGMPNRNGGLSTSDTGTAVIFRDGWGEAESRANDSEKPFKRSEREMLKIALNICDIADNGKYRLNLSISDIKIEFMRKNLTNAQSKTQILCELLNNDKVHPKLAFEAAALFKDNEEAYRISMEYNKENEEKQEEALQKELDNARAEALRTGRQDDSETKQKGDTAI